MDARSLVDLVEEHGGKMCDRCKCCEMTWRPCDYCGSEGVYGHDCGEDTCCCLDPEENVECEWCEGDGGWWWCNCDEKGAHNGAR